MKLDRGEDLARQSSSKAISKGTKSIKNSIMVIKAPCANAFILLFIHHRSLCNRHRHYPKLQCAHPRPTKGNIINMNRGIVKERKATRTST
jgi:hypothetical protein